VENHELTSVRRPRATIGVISDTHGLVRPAALAALRGVDAIVHAGDVGSPEVLAALAEVAPLTAVRGNVDRGAWARRLPAVATVTVAGVRVHVVHDVRTLAVDPVAEGIGVVVAGHSHRPGAVRRDGVLYLNPGSAGPRRFTLPVAVARLRIDKGSVSGEVIPL
jgi:putative phosphoesterase